MTKGLKAFNEAKEIIHMLITSGTYDEDILPKLDAVEKELKAFDVISRKEVNVYDLMRYDKLSTYNASVSFDCRLTEKEYDSLSEAL